MRLHPNDLACDKIDACNDGDVTPLDPNGPVMTAWCPGQLPCTFAPVQWQRLPKWIRVFATDTKELMDHIGAVIPRHTSMEKKLPYAHSNSSVYAQSVTVSLPLRRALIHRETAEQLQPNPLRRNRVRGRKRDLADLGLLPVFAVNAAFMLWLMQYGG